MLGLGSLVVLAVVVGVAWLAVQNERAVRVEQEEARKAQAEGAARLAANLGMAQAQEDEALKASIESARRFLPAGGAR